MPGNLTWTPTSPDQTALAISGGLAHRVTQVSFSGRGSAMRPDELGVGQASGASERRVVVEESLNITGRGAAAVFRGTTDGLPLGRLLRACIQRPDGSTLVLKRFELRTAGGRARRQASASAADSGRPSPRPAHPPSGWCRGTTTTISTPSARLEPRLAGACGVRGLEFEGRCPVSAGTHEVELGIETMVDVA